MKSFLRLVVSLSLTVVIVASAVAQISITAADVGATLALGISITSRTDTATHTANIGTLGATSWNFSTLATNFIGTVISVRPDTTPFFSLFPGSTHSQRYGTGGVGTFYSYQKLGTNLLFPGSAQAGSFQFRSRNVPDAILYQLPMTLGTSWTSAYAESSIITLPPPLPPNVTINNHTVINTVDAYGNLTLPGGGVHQALRIKTDRRTASTILSNRIIIYSFLARNGASVTVVAADTLQPNTGTINVSSVSWSGPVSSDVRLSDAVPADFVLMQNYPNPFNPSTRITYQVAREGLVSMKVFDVLGREIETLISETKSPGTYAVDWNADGIPSGVYFYVMHARPGQAGSFSSVMRMLVLK